MIIKVKPARPPKQSKVVQYEVGEVNRVLHITRCRNFDFILKARKNDQKGFSQEDNIQTAFGKNHSGSG